MPCGSDYVCRWIALDVDGGGASVYGDERAPGMVGEYFHDNFGHVSAGACWDGGEFWAGGGCGGWRDSGTGCGPRFAIDGQLRTSVCVLRIRVFDCVGSFESSCAGA